MPSQQNKHQEVFQNYPSSESCQTTQQPQQPQPLAFQRSQSFQSSPFIQQKLLFQQTDNSQPTFKGYHKKKHDTDYPSLNSHSSQINSHPNSMFGLEKPPNNQSYMRFI